MAASNHKINSAISVVQSLDDRPQLGTTSALKKKFDDGPDSVRLKHNDLCDYIDTSIATKTELQGITQGQILDGSITPAKLSFDPATQIELDAVNTTLTGSIGTTNTNLGTHTADTTKHLSIMTTQGDTIYQGASGPVRLPKGAPYQSFNMNAGTTAIQWMDSLQSLMSASGDMVYASAANTPSRLAKGSDGQIFKMVSGIPSWQTVYIPNSTSGSYTGDGTGPRTISIGFTPKMVCIYTTSTSPNDRFFVLMPNGYMSGGIGVNTFNSAYTTTNGFVINGNTAANYNGITYYYSAIG